MDFEVYLGNKLAGRYNADGSKEQYIHTLKLDTMFQHNAMGFLERRVLPKSRWNQMAKDMYRLREWDPYAICKITHAVMMNDDVWVKFSTDTEDVTWDSVRKELT